MAWKKPPKRKPGHHGRHSIAWQSKGTGPNKDVLSEYVQRTQSMRGLQARVPITRLNLNYWWTQRHIPAVAEATPPVVKAIFEESRLRQGIRVQKWDQFNVIILRDGLKIKICMYFNVDMVFLIKSTPTTIVKSALYNFRETALEAYKTGTILWKESWPIASEGSAE